MADQINVFSPSQVVLASSMTVAGICNFSLNVAKIVPYGWPFAIAVMRALNLE
jgi:hypothetical protein